MRIKALVVGGIVAMMSVSGASAACKINNGTLQANDLLSFGHSLAGVSAQYNRSFTDASWNGKQATVQASNGCKVRVYTASKGEFWVNNGQQLPADAFGIGCKC